MSIESAGFSPWETLPSNTMVRVTISAHAYQLASTFAAAARLVYDRLNPIARLSPVSKLSIIYGQKSAVVDCVTLEKMTGADLLNGLENVGGFSTSFIARAERLTDAQRAAAPTDAGAAERDAAQADAEKNGAWSQLSAQIAGLGSYAKVLVVVVGLVAVAYLVRELKPARK